MRVILAVAMALIVCSTPALADTVSHELAARKFQQIAFSLDKAQLTQVLSTIGGGAVSPPDRDAILAVLDSDAVVSIYVRHLMQVFSEPELLALTEMMKSPAYRAFVERMPTFLQGAMPEIMLYANTALPEAKRRIDEKHEQSTRDSPSAQAVMAENRVLEARLRSAQVSEKTLGNGAVLQEVRFAGSLEPNVDLACITLREVSSKMNPPALIHAAKKCIEQADYAKAWALLTTGYGFAFYDLSRLADRSTAGARDMVTTNAFAGLTAAQREQAAQTAREIQADAQQVKAYCAELTRIGPPTYDPQWAILHGIGAYRENRDGHYLTNVDTQALWEKVLENRCTPR